MAYTFKWEEKGFYIRYFGKTDAAEVIDANEAFFNDPRSESVRYQINDYSEAIPGNVEMIDVDYITALDLGGSFSIHGLLVAFIASNEEIIKYTNYYIDLMRRSESDWKFKIFENSAQAYLWIAEESQPS